MEEDLNQRIKDTYVAPSIGLKYSHEKLLDNYKKRILAAKNEHHREILEKIKEKARPMDHEQMAKRELEYMSNRMKDNERRQADMERQAYEFHHMQFNPQKSKAYLRVANEGPTNKHKHLEKLEKARQANETRKQYSEVVKEIFFKDALLAGRNSRSMVNMKSDLPTLREKKLAELRKKAEEAEKIRLRYELGNKYLSHVREVNANISPEKRRRLDEKRFKRMKQIPRNRKNRKYLDKIARKFDEPHEVVFQKDLIKNLKPTANSEAKSAFIENVRNYDSQIRLKETRALYEANKRNQDEDLGDVYINTIENKLKILEEQTTPEKEPVYNY